MYTLYYDKSEKVLKVSKASKSLQDLNFTEEATFYNDCYYICSERKPLVEKAKEMKQNWISELEKDLISVHAIKI